MLGWCLQYHISADVPRVDSRRHDDAQAYAEFDLEAASKALGCSVGAGWQKLEGKVCSSPSTLLLYLITQSRGRSLSRSSLRSASPATADLAIPVKSSQSSLPCRDPPSLHNLTNRPTHPPNPTVKHIKNNNKRSRSTITTISGAGRGLP